MAVRLTTLTENTAGKMGLLAEHGLSILVETDGRRVLLDAGYSATAVHNARVMGVDLTDLDAIVLSHGHVDHTGGLREVLLARRSACETRILGHPDIWAARYSQRGGRTRFIGLPFRQEELEGLGAHFQLQSGPVWLSEGLAITGEVPRETDFEPLDPNLVVREGESWRQDLLLDDQSIVVRTAAGLVVILGCAHSGVVNTLAHARRIGGDERVFAVVGGTHLQFAEPEQLRRTVEALKGLNIQRLGVSHCTGSQAAARLANEFGETFFFNSAGTVVEF
jgi:7,8-dihydropterin-6-yl-methyl-4-(beta-D-ribofuranosyl)aminobenzene 5'-phosphate synthase